MVRSTLAAKTGSYQWEAVEKSRRHLHFTIYIQILYTNRRSSINLTLIQLYEQVDRTVTTEISKQLTLFAYTYF